VVVVDLWSPSCPGPLFEVLVFVVVVVIPVIKRGKEPFPRTHHSGGVQLLPFMPDPSQLQEAFAACTRLNRTLFNA
jgi:hypothetical protein